MSASEVRLRRLVREMKCDGQTAEIGLQLNLGGEELLPRPPWADQLALQ
jgi:hypothetical protein